MVKFIIQQRDPPCSRLWLPHPFARVMEADQLLRPRPRMGGCCNGAMWVNIEFPAPRFMLLRRGWITFIRTDYLAEGHVFRFMWVQSDMLSVVALGLGVARPICLRPNVASSKGRTRPSAKISRQALTRLPALRGEHQQAPLGAPWAS